jgi:FKBP-type peptidyl-prolyl cis-trans isomerase FklB
MKRFIISFALLSLAGSAFAQDKSTPLKDSKDKVSYSIGLNIGFNLKKQNVSINPDTFVLGLKETMTAFEKEMIDKQKAAGAKNGADGEKYLAENKKKEGVKTTASGLQYKIVKEGTGAEPKETDTVIANYRGTLIDGTEFDSSYKRGQPATFPVSGVIKGWTEALQMMKVGSKYQLFIPANLAYGERAIGPDIGPNSTLIFEVELVGIQSAQSPGPSPK